MITFKQYLTEGGAATAKFKTERADKADIKAALTLVSKTLGIPVKTLEQDLLGSTPLTLNGLKRDSGDIDLAMDLNGFDVQEVNKKMLALTDNQGGYNAGTKVGSYAVPVNGKHVQVDLMFVKSKEYAKFAYHSSKGAKSKYDGVVRKLILLAAIRGSQVKGRDLVLTDDDGRPVVKVTFTMNNDSGMRRTFKMAKYDPKTKTYGKTMKDVSPADIEAHLEATGQQHKFSKDEDFTNEPAKIAALIFGPGTKPEDLLTAEGVIAQIKKLKNSKQILADAKADLEKHDLDVPGELG